MVEGVRLGARLSLREELQCLIGKKVRFQIREGGSSRDLFGVLAAVNSSHFKVNLDQPERYSILLPRKIVYNVTYNEQNAENELIS